MQLDKVLVKIDQKMSKKCYFCKDIWKIDHNLVKSHPKLKIKSRLNSDFLPELFKTKF